MKSRVSFLFYLNVPCQNGGYFALHKSPGYVGAHERALLPAWTVHLPGGTLLLDAFPRAREAEFVRGHRGALHEMCVLQPLVAQRAAQGNAARHGRVRNALGVPPLGVHAWHVGCGGGPRASSPHASQHLPRLHPPLVGRGR